MPQIHVARLTFEQSYPTIYLSSSKEKIHEMVGKHIIGGAPLHRWTIGAFDAFKIPSEAENTVYPISRGGPLTFKTEVARLFEVPVTHVEWNPADTLGPLRLEPLEVPASARLLESGWAQAPEMGQPVVIPPCKLLVQVRVLPENGSLYGCPSYHHDEKGRNDTMSFVVPGGYFYKLIDV